MSTELGTPIEPVFVDEKDGSSNTDPTTTITVRTSSPVRTGWSLLVRAAINLGLPFVNGLMMGFGEIFAHELCFRSGRDWRGVRVVAREAREMRAIRDIREARANSDRAAVAGSQSVLLR